MRLSRRRNIVASPRVSTVIAAELAGGGAVTHFATVAPGFSPAWWEVCRPEGRRYIKLSHYPAGGTIGLAIVKAHNVVSD